jgi:xanthine permease
MYDTQVAGEVSTVNARPPAGTLFVLGLQHVLVMYAGNVAVPLLVAQALRLPSGQTASLINADMFAVGIATLIQTLGIWKFGARLPVMMGATFLSVSPVIAMGLDPNIGLRGFYGALLVAGLAGIAIAPLFGRVLALFPPVVTGSLITLLGISLLSIAMDWAGGGNPSVEQINNGVSTAIVNLAYGEVRGLAVACFVFLIIVAVTRWGRGIWQNLATMFGLVVGTLVSLPLGMVDLRSLAAAPWLGLVRPFQFGVPTFYFGPILTMCIVMVVTLVESTGVFLALAEITGADFRRGNLVQALRADGLGIVAGAVFNAFPYTSFSQNVGLVTITAVRSRFVCAAGGLILMGLGLLPKLASLVAAIPGPVLGGAGLVMFGMVVAAGIRILSAVEFQTKIHNLFIVASALGFGMIPTLSPHFFQHLPAWMSALTSSSVVLGTLIAVMLNLLFNGYRITL